MIKKVSIILCIFVLSFTYCYATSFSDMQNENWNWAKEAVQEMSDEGIITGYPDGNFGPGDDVTKLQSIILLSRIIGVNSSENEEFVELALEQYNDELLTYSTSYKKEIAFLLYKDVIDVSEIDDYISVVNKNSPLKRYEAAVLLTKLMNAEEEVKNKVMVVLPFNDIDEIPDNVQGYVEYVKKQGIMGGMSETEFAPNYNVNRAQMAVMLYRVINKLEETQRKVQGTLSSYNLSDNEITIKSVIDVLKDYEISSDAKIRLDGKPCELNDIEIGTDVMLTVEDDEVVFIEAISPDIDQTIEGIVKTIYYSTGSMKIKVEYTNEDDEEETETYEIDSNVNVTYDGEVKNVNSLNTGDRVTLSLKNDIVKEIDAESKTQYIDGILKEILTDPEIKIVIEDEDDEEREFLIDDDVYVKKNGHSSTLKDLRAGDEVELKLEYDVVERIEAESDVDEDSGIIEELIISKTPSITIKSDGQTVNYNIDRNAVIEISDEIGNIYDLRLGYNVDLEIEGNTVVRLETNAVSIAKQVTGTVDSVNESYGLINVSAVNDNNEIESKQIFVKDNSKIIDSATSNSKDLDDIDEGDIITAIGNDDTGVFEATTIVIINN